MGVDDPSTKVITSCTLVTACASLTKKQCKSKKLQFLGLSSIQCKYKKGLCFKKKENCTNNKQCDKYSYPNDPDSGRCFTCSTKGYCERSYSHPQTFCDL
mmetsp:Transcript_51371/g.55604  ORF Transcript_51371/g.55604 Transcript_51371/m.55604 type:complete len:100 (+) Transcript_51371:539-838(+)